MKNKTGLSKAVFAFCLIFFLANAAVAQRERGTLLDSQEELISGRSTRFLQNQKQRKFFRENAYNFLNRQYFPTAFDQAATQSCNLCAIIYNYYSFELAKKQGIGADNIRFHPFCYYWTVRSSSCYSGEKITAAFEKTIPLDLLPYDRFFDLDCHPPANEIAVQNVKTGKIKNLSAQDFVCEVDILEFYKEKNLRLVVPYAEFNAINKIKDIINRGRPAILIFDAPPSFDTCIRWKGVWRPNPEEYEKKESDRKVYHAMVIVGYDDEGGKDFPGSFSKLEKGTVTVLNSYGQDWGDDGYIKIRYSDLLQWGKQVWTFNEDVEFQQSVQGEVRISTNRGVKVDDEGIKSGQSKQLIDLPKLHLITISNEDHRNKRGTSRVNDRKTIQYEFLKIANSLDYQLVPYNFNQDLFRADSVWQYLRLLSPGPDDIVIVFFRGEGVSEPQKELAAMQLNDRALNCRMVCDSLVAKNSRFNLLITDFSDQYFNSLSLKMMFKRKEIYQDFEPVLDPDDRDIGRYRNFFLTSEGTYWIASQYKPKKKNYAVPGIGDYFVNSLVFAFGESYDIRDLEDRTREKNRADANVFRKEKIYPQLVKSPKGLLDWSGSADPIPLGIPDPKAPAPANDNQTYQLASIQSLLSLEPRLREQSSFDERFRRIATIEQDMSKWASMDLKIVVRENEVVLTEFEYRKYLERLKGARVEDIQVLDLTIGEDGKIREIEIKEEFPQGQDPLMVMNLDKEDPFREGIAVRSLKEVYHFYDYYLNATYKDASELAQSWGKDQMLVSFEHPDRDSIADCDQKICNRFYKNGARHCAFSVRDYARHVLTGTKQVYDKGFFIGAEAPELLEIIPEGDMVTVKIKIMQPYLGEKSSGDGHDDKTRKTFEITALVAPVWADGDVRYTIKRIIFNGVMAECN